MLTKIPQPILEAIRNVNSTLSSYKSEWVSLKRSPWIEKERIHTLNQFLECRLNMEFYYIPELSPIVEQFDGHFIEIMSVVGEKDKGKFENAIAYINKSPDWYLGNEDFSIIIKKAEDFIGGSRIEFNSAPKRPKITILK